MSQSQLLERQLFQLSILILSMVSIFRIQDAAQVDNNRVLKSILILRSIHHLLISIIWRIQLYYPESYWAPSNIFGSKKKGVIFTEIVDVSYFVLAGNGFVYLAYLDSNSCFDTRVETRILGIILCSIGLWAIISGVYYLGPKSLAGEDHFYPEIYRKKNLVKNLGAYRYFDHPIYTIGMLFEWGVAIFAGSSQCLMLAVSGHICALVFMYCTEIPDIQFIYGKKNKEN